MNHENECVGCKSYYLYFSRKEFKYIITENSLEAFDNGPWIPLRNESISNLIKLIQDHESKLQNNKANLSTQEFKVVNFKDYKTK